MTARPSKERGEATPLSSSDLAELERLLDACLSLPDAAKVTVPSRLLRGAAARVRELEAALRLQLSRCPTCGGTGVMYLHEDEASCGMTPGSSARDCSDCSDARAAFPEQTP